MAFIRAGDSGKCTMCDKVVTAASSDLQAGQAKANIYKDGKV
jgi:hypothetical protein